MAADFDSVPEVPDPSSYVAPTVGDLAYDDIEGGELIGVGGFAEVSLTTVNGSEIGVKEPSSNGRQTIKRRETIDAFFDEAETWARLDDHDHIVGVLDWGESIPWIALEHMDGGSLTDRLQTGSLATDEALWIGVCLSRAVHHAHRYGISHLDLTPNNVLFRDTEPGRWPLPKVGDWGLSKKLLEQTGTMEELTPNYAAPEQFDPDEYGQPDDYTDRFQLGAVVYEMLTGEQAFTGSAASVMRQVLDGDVTPPTVVNSGLPDRLDDIFERALAVEKSDRYETVVNFRRDLASVFETAHGQTADQSSSRVGQRAEDPDEPAVNGTDSELVSTGESTGGSTNDRHQESIDDSWDRTDRLVDRLPKLDADVDYAGPLTAPFNGEQRVPAVDEVPLRLPVQDVYTISDLGTVPVGRVETGVLDTGESVRFEPSGAGGTVGTVEINHEEVPAADPGDEVGFSVRGIEKDDIRRGDLCGTSSDSPPVAETFQARLLVSDHPSVITAGYTPVVHVHTAQVACCVESLDAKLDAETGAVLEEKPDYVQSGDVAAITLHPQQPLSVEPATRIPELGTFSVRDMGQTIGVGIVLNIDA